MNSRLNACLPAALLLLILAAAAGTREHRFDSGPCKEGEPSEWYCVTTFEDGQVIFVQGRGCDGRFYQYDICDDDRHIVGSDPVAEQAGAYGGNCETGGSWRGAILLNGGMQFAGAHGRNCAGEYYVIEPAGLIFPEGEPGEAIE